VLSHYKQHQRMDNQNNSPRLRNKNNPPSGSGYSTSAPSGYATSTGLLGSKPGLPSAKTSQPRAHLLLNKGRGTKVFFTVLFRTLDLFSFLTFSFFTLVLSFTFVSAMLSHFTVLVQFYIFTSQYLSMHIYYYQEQTTPKKGRDIIPDILSLKTTHAFWRQNTFNLNKPAPFGAKLLGAFHWKCSTPFYS
jgi:hypothetical protein